jgi:hypothetical protein
VKKRTSSLSTTRVVFHLPISQEAQEGVIMDLLEWLREVQQKHAAISGCMHSDPWPPLFRGYSWDHSRDVFEKQGSVMFVVDFRYPESPRPLVLELRNRLRSAYALIPPGGFELGIVAHPIEAF